MKLNGKTMAVVAMVLGSMAAIGCNRAEDREAPQETAPAPVVAAPSQDSTPAAPAAQPAAAKSDEGVTVAAKTSVGASLPPRPADRVEHPGVAPSRDHRWTKGHWRYEGVRGYVWTPGRWVVEFAPAAPPAPRYENPGRPISDRHMWVPGHWERSSRDWTWIGGHWTIKRTDQRFVAARWERQNGRYVYVPGRWVRR